MQARKTINSDTFQTLIMTKKIKLSCQFYTMDTVFPDKNKIYFDDFLSKCDKEVISHVTQ